MSIALHLLCLVSLEYRTFFGIKSVLGKGRGGLHVLRSCCCWKGDAGEGEGGAGSTVARREEIEGGDEEDEEVVEGAGESCEDVEERSEAADGDARSSLSSEGAGVTGGVSGMAGMGLSLKQADS